MTPDRRATLDSAIATAVADAPDGVRLLAIGWSTVDLERAEREFDGTFADADADALLGARCRIAHDVGAVPVVVLEPSTEGRLAASLARLGEGPVVVWYVPTSSRSGSVGTPTAGPFGLETLLPAPHRDHRLTLLVGTGPVPSSR